MLLTLKAQSSAKNFDFFAFEAVAIGEYSERHQLLIEQLLHAPLASIQLAWDVQSSKVQEKDSVPISHSGYLQYDHIKADTYIVAIEPVWH
jgi:hypothetical protein